jgi:hypothetical protein
MKMAKFFRKVVFPWKKQEKNSEQRAADDGESRMVETGEWRIANGEWLKIHRREDGSGQRHVTFR